MLLSDHEVEDAAFDEDDLDDLFAFEEGFDLIGGLGEGHRFFLARFDGAIEDVARLAVDGDRQFDGVFLQVFLVIGRPGLVSQ